MTDQWVLSIVARPPIGFEPSGSVISDGNNGIAKILEKLKRAEKGPAEESPLEESAAPYVRRYRTAVDTAAYVSDIVRAVRKFKQGNGVVPDIIQLIGHGTPGRLALGSYWSGKVKDPKLGYAVLDSNPESYGMLRNETPSTARIFLLGCCVGSSEPSGYVASGRALLFDLEDMTGANVYAADDLVHPGLFVNGLYTGSLVTSSGKPANPAVLPFAPDIRATTFSEKANAIPALAGVLSSPALGFQVDLIAPGHSFIDLFKDYSLALPQPEGLLAMSEIEFEAAGYSRVDAICGLRYVRFQVAGGDTKYYERPTGSKPIDLGRQGDPAPALKALKDDYLAQLA